MKELKDKYHYTIIGDGVERPIVEEKIHQYGLEEQITLLGELSNPYGYLKAADLLLIPSVSEAAPMVIGEAACLGTPVLSTRTSSAEEMITEPGYGWVCENSTDGLILALRELLENTEQITQKKKMLADVQMDNGRAMQIFSELMDI